MEPGELVMRGAGGGRTTLAGDAVVGGAGGGRGRGEGGSSEPEGHLAVLAEGTYRFGIRASDCWLRDAPAGSVAVRARVELSEITGSETFVYLRGAVEPVQFIVQRDGVYHYQLDEELTFYLEPGRLLVFEADGGQRLVASYHVGQADDPADPGRADVAGRAD
jgi:hypothetical protein